MLQLRALARVWWKAAVGIAIGAALAFPMGHFIGHRSGVRDGIASEQKAEAKRLDAARKAVKAREAKADKVTAKVSSDLTKTQTQIVYRTRTLIEKVNVYVPQAADDRCVLPFGVVLLHNAAASPGSAPELSEGPGGSESRGPVLPAPDVLSAPSGVKLSDLSETVVFNYGVALGWRAENLAWREWWTAQSVNWEKR